MGVVGSCMYSVLRKKRSFEDLEKKTDQFAWLIFSKSETSCIFFLKSIYSVHNSYYTRVTYQNTQILIDFLLM